MAKDDTDDPIIEIVTQLDNAMFLLALAGGIVLGVVLIYGWQEYQKQQGEKLSAAIRGAVGVQAPIDYQDTRPAEVAYEPAYT